MFCQYDPHSLAFFFSVGYLIHAFYVNHILFHSSIIHNVLLTIVIGNLISTVFDSIRGLALPQNVPIGSDLRFKPAVSV